MQLWIAALLTFYLLALGFDLRTVNGLDRRVDKNEETKVKCKEVVDEALRQYWDHSNENAGTSDGDHNDEDDDHDSGENIECQEEKSDEQEEEEEEEDHSDDRSEHTDEDKEDKDGDEDDHQDKSGETNEDDNDDHNDGDNDHKADEDDHDDKQENQVQMKKDSEEEKDSSKSDEEVEHKKESDEQTEGDNEEDDKNEESNELAEQIEKARRSRTHIDDILKVYEIGSQEVLSAFNAKDKHYLYDTSEQNLILSLFREMKRLYETSVKPLEMIYKYRHITTRLITDAELLRKQSMVLLLGGKSTGKTSLINYLLGIDDTSMHLTTGPTTGYNHFTVLSYGDNYTRLSPTELSADFTFSSLQQFGQQFLEHYIEAYRMPITLLQKMTIVDTPGLADPGVGNSVVDNDVYQWFIDRSDVIYIVIDVTQLQLSTGLKQLIEQLKGRDVRFLLSKADLVPQQSHVVAIIGQLLWMLSPIMPSERPPQVFALTTVPQQVYDLFMDEQEVSWLKDLSDQISGIQRIESRVAALRRHAIRVRNHAKLVDCYLATFYKNKGIFTFGASSRQLASDITENPQQYRVYSGALAGQSQNISRYDLPDPGVYREFFRSNPLIDFKPLTSTCSYFKGCPIDKLDITIAYQLPELVGKYKKLTRIQPYL